MDRLEAVFQCLFSCGLKLKPSKCHLLKEKVIFLGHVVSGKGIRPNPSLISDVEAWNPPTSVHELKAFLGMCNYYRKFVLAFSELASPLNERKEITFLWTEEHQNAFTQLKEKLTSEPVLGYPLVKGKYILDTDPSHKSRYWCSVVTTSVGRGEGYHLCKHPPHSSPDEILCNETRVASCCFIHPPISTLPAWKEVPSTHRSQQPHLVLPVQHPEGQFARWLEELCQYM